MSQSDVRELLRANWHELDTQEQMQQFKQLPQDQAQELFWELSSREQAHLLLEMALNDRLLWIRALEPDDVADAIQETPDERRQELLSALDPNTLNQVTGLLAYREDVAGGLMSPRFATLRAEMTVGQALAYLRQQARDQVETFYYVYVVDSNGVLIGVSSLRELFHAAPSASVQETMKRDMVTATEDMDQEELSRLFAINDLLAVPVVDKEGKIKGIVTIDDIVDVVEEEATEDIQKIGGSEALHAPYLDITLTSMIKKRAGWLILLFLGEMLTTNAMSQYQDELAKAVVLSVFIPLIISSGGNSGSQASTLVVRAMALGQVQPKDWIRVFRREVTVGISIGLIIGTLGFVRVATGQLIVQGSIGEHSVLIGLAVGATLICMVLWGGICGAMLPFMLRRAGLDPASASAPFVATLVDVTGLIIYFTIATAILTGKLL